MHSCGGSAVEEGTVAWGRGRVHFYLRKSEMASQINIYLNRKLEAVREQDLPAKASRQKEEQTQRHRRRGSQEWGGRRGAGGP